MLIAKVQFASWDKAYDFSANDLKLKPGDRVVVKTELGSEVGVVICMKEQAETDAAGEAQPQDAAVEPDETGEKAAGEKQDREIKPVIRKATSLDLEKTPSGAERAKALAFSKLMKERLGLPMKFIDAHFSFDGSRITFAFIADGRVDFRELVKELTRHFGRTIRLQQIGIRDEAKIMGDYGHCGQPLCCKRFLRDLSSITSEMAELQQCAHRGSERISGICGRLMCCLSYEEKGYEDLAAALLPIGSKVSMDGKKGIVVGHNILKQTLKVEFGGENNEQGAIVEVDLNERKKKSEDREKPEKKPRRRRRGK